MTYIGRFAPSPSGPLHFGSLIAALGSWLDARANDGQWLLRIEDLDPPREMAGAAELIIESLQRHGLYWDGDIVWQSDRLQRYDEVLEHLSEQDLTYRCYCSRKQIRAQGGLHLACATSISPDAIAATRMQVTSNPASFDDCFYGNQTITDAQANEDFILKRKDDLHAYMLAVVVDDIEQNISHIIRGADLLTTTCQQIYLFQKLNAKVPVFGHLPLATRNNGDKLSKQNHAPAIDDSNALKNLIQALKFLQQPIPETKNIEQLLNQAVTNWQPERFKHFESANVREEYSQ